MLSFLKITSMASMAPAMASMTVMSSMIITPSMTGMALIVMPVRVSIRMLVRIMINHCNGGNNCSYDDDYTNSGLLSSS
jgi:hypothetical protein